MSKQEYVLSILRCTVVESTGGGGGGGGIEVYCRVSASSW